MMPNAVTKEGEAHGAVLICHAEEPLHLDGVARWLAANGRLRGIVAIHDSPAVRRRRVRREYERSGATGLLDVLAFRVVHRIRRGAADSRWAAAALVDLRRRYAPVPDGVPIIHVERPNGPEVEEFLASIAPDFAIALCKHILKPRIFQKPRFGTFVMHPGICPEYRNAHGCFWAIAAGDMENVGLTLLQIDEGVDTGPVYGYFRVPFDTACESHIVIQQRLLLENLEPIWARMEEVAAGRATAISVAGRESRTWGQPRLSHHLRPPGLTP